MVQVCRVHLIVTCFMSYKWSADICAEVFIQISSKKGLCLYLIFLFRRYSETLIGHFRKF